MNPKFASILQRVIQVPSNGKLPRGFRAGAVECGSGQTYLWVIRNSDGASVQCIEVPHNSDMVMRVSDLRASLHAACDTKK
jgi:hypothetical protein